MNSYFTELLVPSSREILAVDIVIKATLVLAMRLVPSRSPCAVLRLQRDTSPGVWALAPRWHCPCWPFLLPAWSRAITSCRPLRRAFDWFDRDPTCWFPNPNGPVRLGSRSKELHSTKSKPF